VRGVPCSAMKKLLTLAALLVLAVPASAAHLPILASQDVAPVFAPDGRHVAYTVVVNGQGRVFDLETVDTATRRSSHVGRGSGSPSASWSSDGRIAWSSGGILYEANATGTGKTRYAAPAPAFAPAWRPGSGELAYLTHHGAQNLDLWVGATLWAKDAIGKPAWSPDGSALAFDRDDGVYVTTGAGAERRVATIDNPGGLAWSSDGRQIAYIAHRSLYVVDAAGGSSALKVRNVPPTAIAPSWSDDDARISADRAWSPTDAGTYVAAGPRPGCPGHTVLLLNGKTPLTGSCTIPGTAAGDVLAGTGSWGDVILAGAGNDRIHANDRHTDRVDCGPGRDTVWADKSDKLVHCEVVHR
jgi:WD40-like Beta Propeller Repeat